MAISIDEQVSLLSRRCERMLTEQDLKSKLRRSAETRKPLRIKLGMDPTAPDVTLGHCVPLKVIRQFQEWGHKAVLIIGDFTARVGDPTGRNQTRPQLSPEEIDANARTYVAQIGKVLLTDAAHLEVRYNSEWLGRMNMAEVIKLASRATVAQMLTREDFAKRYAEGREIRLHEIMYPLLQGWDSVMIEADVEMGGSDQLFNNMVGRGFQQEEGKEGQVVIVTPLLVGTDGVKKMSKSLKNYIGVTDPPSGQSGIFGKVMSLPDALMESYYTLLTDLPPEEFRGAIQTDPRGAKVRLARHLIAWLHSPEAAEAAEAEWNRLYPPGQKSKGEAVPDDIADVPVSWPSKLAPVLAKAGLATSNGEATRKIKEGAVYIDGEKVTDFQKEFSFDKPVVVKLGRKYARLVPGG